MATTTKDMTEGSIGKQIFLFAVPLLIGNLFQQLYNAVDSVVVGNFVGKQALAAVGSTGMVINMLVGFCMGLSTGCSVVISQAFGAGDREKLKRSIHTTVLLSFVLGIICTVVGILSASFMVRFMKTPEDVMIDAVRYLRSYFMGVSGLIIYNMGSGILRAVGDSQRPLYFLCVSSVLNIALDLLFVVSFHMGIAGVAYATILSQFISAVLVLGVLTMTKDIYKVTWKEIRFHGEVLKRICAIGFPAGLQTAITCFSNVFLQSYINQFGSACMAGWTSYSKIDQIALLPMQSLALSTTTFVGQNVGAGKLKRADDGRKTATKMSVGITLFLSALIILFASQVILIFNREPDVVYYGRVFLRFMPPFLAIGSFNQVMAAALRGLGDAKGPMVIMLSSFVVFRQAYLALTSIIFPGSIYPVAFAYPAGWIVCSITMAVYYRYAVKKRYPEILRKS